MLVQYEQPKPQVALIRLNRPDKMNAFSTELESDLNITRGAQISLSKQALEIQSENTQMKEELAFLQRLFSDSGKQGAVSIERLTAEREDDERSVMQAFAEAAGQAFLLPNLSWHWWLSDGELNEVQYTGRRGYYHALGPAHAHTIYAGTPLKLKTFLLRMQSSANDAVSGDAGNTRIRPGILQQTSQRSRPAGQRFAG